MAILRLLADGVADRQIAEGLRLAEGTAKHCVTHIVVKAGARHRVRAAIPAQELELTWRGGGSAAVSFDQVGRDNVRPC